MSETVNKTQVTKDSENKTLLIERVFDAPRDRVWQAWTDPEVFVKWWGPRGWQTEVKDADFREGGKMVYGMKCVDEAQGEWFGQTSWGKMEFTAINEPESLSYKDWFCDENGVADTSMPSTLVSMEFIDQDGKTLVRSSSVFESTEGYEQVLAMGVVEGVTETWDRLDEILAA